MTFDDNEHGRKQAALNDAAAKLIDDGAFSSLVILASWETEDGSTAAVQATRGNWYAQNGLADHFLTKRREQGRVELRQQLPDHDDGQP